MNANLLLGEEWATFLPKAEELLEPIQARLKEELTNGMLLLPDKNNIFRIFRDIPPSKVSIVWLGQDPYNTPPGMATGRAFECGKYPSASWRKISEVYKKTVPDPKPDIIRGDLRHWVNQGVFLINKALTVRYKMPNAHTKLWEPFTRYVIGQLLTDMDPKAVILLGGEAQRMVGKTPAPHSAFIYEHPAAASYQGRSWNADTLFTRVNEFLKFHNKEIDW